MFYWHTYNPLSFSSVALRNEEKMSWKQKEDLGRKTKPNAYFQILQVYKKQGRYIVTIFQIEKSEQHVPWNETVKALYMSACVPVYVYLTSHFMCSSGNLCLLFIFAHLLAKRNFRDTDMVVFRINFIKRLIKIKQHLIDFPGI